MAAGHHLPDLSALVSGHQRRRRRRPARHSRAPRLPRVARRRRGLAVADLSARRWRTSATTSPTTATSIRCSARWPISTALLAEAHARGLKVILDFVPNHTSDQHPWFIESRASRDNPKRDWYIWRDPAPGGGPPNNWLSAISAARLGARRGDRPVLLPRLPEEQPDLNWRNPEVREAMFDVLRFWLDRGVDGFRVDVIWHLIKDDAFRDNPPNPAWTRRATPTSAASCSSTRPTSPRCTTSSPRCARVARRVRRAHADRRDLPAARALVTYYGAGPARRAPAVQFPADPRAVERARDRATDRRVRRRAAADGWPNWVLGNHDKPRIAAGSAARRRASPPCCC